VGGTCGTNGVEENAEGLLMVKPDGKRALRRPRHRRVNNTKFELRDVVLCCRKWIHLAA
jgi:hypothetical protein